jgi:hypothetical protein
MAYSFGRPKEYDRIQIGKQMVEWSKNPEALTIPMFATSIGLHSGVLRVWCTQDEDFRALFITAKENVGINRLKAVSDSKLKLDPGIYNRSAHFYDMDLKEDFREEKRFDADLKKDIEGAKQSTYILEVSPGLAIGSNIPAQTVSNIDNQGAK